MIDWNQSNPGAIESVLARFVAEQAEVVAAMLSLADRTLDEAGYAAWLRDKIVPNVEG